jgi:hypothetical protein
MKRAGQFVPDLSEDLRRHQQNGRVRIVPAGVHHARILRRIEEVVLLLERKRVHIGAKGDGCVRVRILHPPTPT